MPSAGVESGCVLLYARHCASRLTLWCARPSLQIGDVTRSLAGGRQIASVAKGSSAKLQNVPRASMLAWSKSVFLRLGHRTPLPFRGIACGLDLQLRTSAPRCGQVHACATRFGEPDCNRLLRRSGPMLPFSDMVHFFANKLSGLRARQFAFAFIFTSLFGNPSFLRIRHSILFLKNCSRHATTQIRLRKRADEFGRGCNSGEDNLYARFMHFLPDSAALPVQLICCRLAQGERRPEGPRG